MHQPGNQRRRQVRALNLQNLTMEPNFDRLQTIAIKKFYFPFVTTSINAFVTTNNTRIMFFIRHVHQLQNSQYLFLSFRVLAKRQSWIIGG